MRSLAFAASLLFAVSAVAADFDETLDRVDAALRFSTADESVRARISGTLDLEGYHFSGEPLGLIDTTHDWLFSPRLTLFLDAQVGSALYFFAQARIDRGFDAGDRGAQVRLDEYALRFSPSQIFNVQIGRFATVTSRWVGRHLSWDNPFINAPGPYENITVASDTDPPLSIVRGTYSSYYQSPRYERLPIVWGPNYTTGIAISGSAGPVDYAAELKNSSLSSRPEVWNAFETGFDHPTVSARLGFRPNEMWNFGVSGSRGAYLRESAEYIPFGKSYADYYETVVAQDASFEWHHWQLWAEVFEARFELPYIGNADTLAYYLEAKYKLTPQLFAALRWNQQFFGTVTDTSGVRAPWDYDRSRVDAALTYRLTTHTQVKLQYTVEIPHPSDERTSHTVAAQFTLRF